MHAQLVWSCQAPGALQREVDTMVALGGDLYIYGGTKRTPEGKRSVLSDIIVARAQGGVVNQPWKRLFVSKPFTSLQSSSGRLHVSKS